MHVRRAVLTITWVTVGARRGARSESYSTSSLNRLLRSPCRLSSSAKTETMRKRYLTSSARPRISKLRERGPIISSRVLQSDLENFN